MVLPQIHSGVKVGRTCGKALSRKELKEAQPCILGGHRSQAVHIVVSTVKPRFSELNWEMTRDAVEIVRNRIHCAPGSDERYQSEEDGLTARLAATAATPFE